ncbi:MAG: alcohol dehydrogenase catalytic domain-containing protein [Sedimentisphaerales bacterium]|nr:alcohol dehydrogenase catalytic domain-containing protein [Sedimentisphaerales bacterium]
MKALVFKNGKLQFCGDEPEPAVMPETALIEVEYAGICSTDLEIIKGYMGFEGIPGHEFIGRVIKGPAELLGKRVTAEINCVCGKCNMCRSGLSTHCLDRQTIGIYKHNGAFAEQIVVPLANIHIIPEELTIEQAIFIEPLAAAFQICHQIEINQSDKVAIIGDGRLGLLVAQAIGTRVSRHNLTVVGKHQEKLDFLKKLGFQVALLDKLPITPQWDIAIDCSGKASGFETAIGMLRPRGRLILKSTFVPDKAVDLSPVVINELEIIGSRCGPFEDAIKALLAGEVNTNGLITGCYNLQDGVKAFAAASEPQHIKVIFKIGNA